VVSERPTPRTLRVVGLCVVTLLCADAALGLIAALHSLIEQRLLGQLDAMGPTESAAGRLIESLREAARRRRLLDQATLAATFATAPAFLVWFHRAYGNLRAMGESPRTTPARATLGWFIPLGNLYLPYRAAQEIRTLSGNPTSSWVVFGWWILWLLSRLTERLAALAIDGGNLTEAISLHGAAAFEASCSAILGAVFVARVTRAQTCDLERS